MRIKFSGVFKRVLSNQTIRNKKTLQAVRAVEKKKGLVKAKDAEDLFKKLGIEKC